MITYRKNVYDQLIDSDIKRYEEMEKITRRQGEYFTTRCFLEYEYFKNHYRLIAVDLCRKKLLDADSNQFNKQNLVNNIKKLDAGDNAKNAANNDQSMFVLIV